MYQLTKVPLLFEHYSAHHAADKNLTFIGFLYEHYIISDANAPDYMADMQLPFKSHNESIAANISSLSFTRHQDQELIPVKYKEVPSKIYPVYMHPFSSSAYLSSIWQPPKSC